MLVAVSSRDAACCSVREDRSVLPRAISELPTKIELLLLRTLETMPDRLSCMSRMAANSLPISLRPGTWIRWDRSARAIRCRFSTASCSGATTALRSTQ